MYFKDLYLTWMIKPTTFTMTLRLREIVGATWEECLISNICNHSLILIDCWDGLSFTWGVPWQGALEFLKTQSCWSQEKACGNLACQLQRWCQIELPFVSLYQWFLFTFKGLRHGEILWSSQLSFSTRIMGSKPWLCIWAWNGIPIHCWWESTGVFWGW